MRSLSEKYCGGIMAHVRAKVHLPIEPSDLAQRHERFLVPFAALLVDAYHLASAAGSQHSEILTADCEFSPSILCPWEMVRILSWPNQYVASECLGGDWFPASRLNFIVEGKQT